MRFGMTIRYQAQAAMTSAVIGWTCLKKLIYVQSGVATGQTCFLAFRIRRVTVYCQPLIGTSSYTAPTPISIRVREGEGAIATERYVSDVSSGAQGAMCTVKFKDTTQDIGKWHDATYAFTNERAFQIGGPTGMLVDLKFSCQLAVSTSNMTSLTASSGTAGGVYFNYLDNTASGGSGVGNGYLLPINVVGNIGLAY